ncbi:3316_t:CDS:1 [Funneliformis geosporum]|uniref:20055_t:CDS:1 n=1 Tax=Funneliformis geosporum TaxID=1117311 RepID=A0A9W4WHF1_9GLOM|nr:20055_t:CDS:1 [Funneliformis geosporum]CAI2162007.1 3316_t:CDS:1 [Funneliformis geosporum]
MGDQISSNDKESDNSSVCEKGSKIEIASNSSEYERNESSATPSRNSVDQSILINPPFPPNVDPRSLAIDLLNNKKTSKKLLNEFFIYRKEFVRELKRQNLRPRQTKVSTLASTSWHRQPPNVKNEYRRLARETDRFLILARSKNSKSTKTESSESSYTSPDSAPDFISVASSSALSVSNPDNLQLSAASQMSHHLLRMSDALNPSVLQTGERSIQLDNFRSTFEEFSLYGQGNTMSEGFENLGNNVMNFGNLNTLEHQNFLPLRTSEPYDYRNTMSYHPQRQSYTEFLEPSWSTLDDNLSQFTNITPVNRVAPVRSSEQHDYSNPSLSPYQSQYVENIDTSMSTLNSEVEQISIVPSQRYLNRDAPSSQGTNNDTSASSSGQSTIVPWEILRRMPPPS